MTTTTPQSPPSAAPQLRAEADVAAMPEHPTTVVTSESADLPSYPIPRECPYRPSAGHEPLAAAGPVSKVRLYNGKTAWLITGPAQARAVLSDVRRVSIRNRSENYPMLNEEFYKVVESGYADVLFGVDPPEHTKQRQMLVPSFTLRRIAEMRPDIQRIVDEKIDAMLSQGPPGDLVTQFSQPVPSMVMSLLLGVPYTDHEEFETPARKLFVPELADEATTELGDYLDRLIGRKERNPATPGTPGAGLLDDLIVEQLHTGAIGRSELVHIAMSMLVAGTDTTTNVISLGTLALLDTPGQWEALRDDLSLVRGAVDEILRYVSLVEVFARVAAEDLTVGGQEIKAGDGMLISCAVPNFDPTWAVADPQAFDIRRPPRQHLAFSHGIHRCIGDNLARLELEVAFATLAARMPNLRPAAPISQMPTNNDGTLQRLYQFPILW